MKNVCGNIKELRNLTLKFLGARQPCNIGTLLFFLDLNCVIIIIIKLIKVHIKDKVQNWKTCKMEQNENIRHRL